MSPTEMITPTTLSQAAEAIRIEYPDQDCQLKRNMIRIAQREEKRWYRYRDFKRRDKRDEDDAEVLNYLQSYWSAVPGINAAAQARLSARDANGAAWSAAFISYVLTLSGVTPAMGYTPSGLHMDYIVQAIRNREGNIAGTTFKAFRPDEVDPRPGDLICLNRSFQRADGTTGITSHTYEGLKGRYFGTPDRLASTPSGASHCDIVTDHFQENTRTGSQDLLEAIGGNVDVPGRLRESVTPKYIRLNRGQYPTGRDFGMSANIFAILRLTVCPTLTWELKNEPLITDVPTAPPGTAFA